MLCHENCFNCPYEDCILDSETLKSKRQSFALDNEFRSLGFDIRSYMHFDFYRDIMENDYLFNRPITIMYGRCYYLEHRQARLEYGKQYYRDNREQRLNYASNYYQLNAEKKREYQRNYYKEHKDEINLRRSLKRRGLL